MGPIESWGILIIIVGGLYYYYVYKKPSKSRPIKRAEEVVVNTKGSALYLGNISSGNEAITEKKKKRPAKKSAKPQSTASKTVLSSDASDDEVAQDEDPKEAMKRLHALKSGKSLPSAESTGSKPEASTVRARQVPQKKQEKKKATQKSPLATASQASSTGADADIDDEPLVSGANPSDMLEETSTGARVMTITPSSQPPRQPKAKKEPAPEPGTQHKKNQKKKEKAKAAREEEQAALRASREQYRALQKAEEAAKQRSQLPPPAPSESIWTTVNGKNNKKVSEPALSTTASSDLLDTSDVRNTSDDEPRTHASNLDASHWEEIPAHVRDEGEWKEVSTKKIKEKTKPATPSNEGAASSKEEKRPKKLATSLGAGVSKATPIIRNRSVNGFEALSGDSAVSTRSSDWAEVDAWDVHPQ